MKSRTMYSIKNIKYSLIGQMINIIVVFVARIIFIKILSAEYLGLSNLFTNILTILSLTELGFTTAMSYQLYRPISENNTSAIKTLLSYYKKIYNYIFLSIIILGLLSLPIYPFFIQEIPQIENIDLIYILFVINSAASYLFSYKRLLIVSDQQKYIDTFFKYFIFLIQNVIQIIVLYITHNYILFLVIQIISTLSYNILTSLKANKMYPYLKEKERKIISNKDKNEIKKNVSSMFFHKFGGIVLNSSDNIIISKYLGLYINGLYSNYYLIISSLNAIITQLFNSLVASIGNLNTINNKIKMTNVFKKIFFANFFIYNICCCCLLNLFNPFIEIWVGESFLLSEFTVIILVINFYVFGMRRSMMVFREATGNYSKDKISPIIESIINIIVSIVFVKICGVAGVFIGTIVSSLCTNFWLEPLVVSNESFTLKLMDYFKIYFKYLIVVVISISISYFTCKCISSGSIISLVIKGLISFTIPVIVIILLFRRSEEYLFYKKTIANLFKKKGELKND